MAIVSAREMAKGAPRQARPLDSVYPIVYLDGLSIKVRHNEQVDNKTFYLARG